MSKKWTSPLQSIMQSTKDITTVESLVKEKQALKDNENNIQKAVEDAIPSSSNKTNYFKSSSENTILKIDPKKICNWELHDRTSYELGDLEALANDLKINGQQQPCLVRPYISNDKTIYEYELIAGERRWRAAVLANISLDVIVRALNDQEAAFCQISENAHRKDISEFSKGMNYSILIEKGILTAKDLESKLGLSQSQVSRLLSFNKVPKSIWDAIGDPSKVSARTASEMRSLIKLGSEYEEALIHLAPKIKTGKLGEKTIKLEVESYLKGIKLNLSSAEEIKNATGRHLFTWRKDSNNNISISFPKDIRLLMDRDRLGQLIKEGIETMINERL